MVGGGSERAAASGPAIAQVRVAGLVLRIEAEQITDISLLERLLGVSVADGEPDATLVIGSTVPALPDSRSDYQSPYGDHWDDGMRHSFWHHWGLGAIVEADRARLGGPATGYRRWVAVRNSMLFVLARLFYERGRFVLHGAAIRRAGLGLVIVGDSGAGKSTLAYLASRDGWSVLGDDMVVIDPGSDHPFESTTVRGIPRVPSIPGEVARLTDARGEPLPEDERDRVELVGFPLDHEAAPVSGVVVCGHGDDEGHVRPLDPIRAVEALVPAFVLSALEEPVRRWFPTAMAIGRGPSVELGHPQHVDDRLDRAARLLDEAAARCPGPEPSHADHRP
jgi:hypothetical protein